MESNSYASTAGGTPATSGPSVPLVAETGEPVPDSQLKPVHSNYVPAQVCDSIERVSVENYFLASQDAPEVMRVSQSVSE